MNRSYNVLDEAEQIAGQFAPLKPENILVTDADWDCASEETKGLLIRVERLEQPLETAYHEAVRQEFWKRALLLYQALMGKPRLSSITPLLYDERECIKRETEFIAEAREWLLEANELLMV